MADTVLGYLSYTKSKRGGSEVETDKNVSSNAILVQLLLSLDRRDLAQTTYQNVKKFGNDNILVQAMEAWIGLKTVSPSLLKLRLRIRRVPGGERERTDTV